MKELTLVLKYPQAARQWRNWANSEWKIDFRHDLGKATRCTISYAVAELQYFLERSLPEVKTVVSETLPPAGPDRTAAACSHPGRPASGSRGEAPRGRPPAR